MSKVDILIQEIDAKKKELDALLNQERDSELADIIRKIKLFGFKTSDFRGALATRKKRSSGETRIKQKRNTKV
jgi:hypothetical protein